METSALKFAEPLWFWALLVVPAVALLHYWSHRRSRALIAKIVAPRLREQLAGSVSVGRRAFRVVLLLLSLVFLIVAMAQPQLGYVQREVKQRGRDVIIAVDTSRSMLATDVTPSRLARAKLISQDLLRLLGGDRVGLIAFAGSAFLQAPLTMDKTAVLNSLEDLDTDVIPRGGTNIAEAIKMAVDAFGKAEGKTKVLVILTDGEELAADGIQAAREAAEKGVRIFTVGIGSGEGSLIPIRTPTGQADFVRDANDKPVQSRLDETRLKEIAEAGKGFYEPLGADVARNIFEKGILPLEKSEMGVQSARQPIERYQWPLSAAIFFLLAWMLVSEKRRVRRTAPRVVKPLAAASIVLFAVSAHAQTGIEDYHSGKYDQAMVDFEKRLKSNPESDKLQFNAGDAAYKLGDYAKAADYFTKALLSDDNKLREDASYNLANSLVRKGEALPDKDKKKADWENAIQHYDEALKLNDKNLQAKENRDIVKKMLEDLKKEEQKQDQQNKDQQNKDQQNKDQQNKDQQNKDQQNKDQQNKDQQNKDQQNKDQQNKDQQNKDQQNKDQQNKDQQNKDQQNKDQQNKDQQNKDQQNKDQQNKDQQNKDQQNKDQQNQQGDEKKDQQSQQKQDDKPGKPQPTPTPGEKKQGDLKPNEDQNKDQADEKSQEAAPAEETEKEGEMSKAQAAALLNSLRGDEERVRLMQRLEDNNDGKDW
jgi:Ca-activated chloride channel family protein